MLRMNTLYVGLSLLVFLNLGRVYGTYWDISRKGWLQLEEMQDYICGLSSGYQDGNYTRGIGWFCVTSAGCREGTKALPPKLQGSEPHYQCDSLRYNEGRDKCCYIGLLQPPLDINTEDYSTYLFTRNTSVEYDITSLDEYKTFLSYEMATTEKTEVLNAHDVCGIVPAGKREFTTLYQPYICMKEDECEEKHPLFTPLKFGPVGDAFCSRGSQRHKGVCCHMSAAFTPEQRQRSWVYKELPPQQRYAPGFRSSFMCEQYNHLVCEGSRDRCPMRIMERDTAWPGEFPHQVLIGITTARTQFFHCAGSLVSATFVLSAYDCHYYSRLPASLALVGDYNLLKRGERWSKEQITYINKHYTKISQHYFVLFRLWRPVKMNFLLRPACLDWFSKKVNYKGTEYDFGTGWLTGYGPQNKNALFNETVKRYKFEFKELRELDQCNRKVPYNKHINNFILKNSDSHICLNVGRKYSPLLNTTKDFLSSPGYFDMGAPFTILDIYCRWNLYGVSIQNPKSISQPPTLVETVPRVLQWIEDIVWRNDFDLLSFNMSLPECADPHGYAFYGMKFLNKDYNKWYNHTY